MQGSEGFWGAWEEPEGDEIERYRALLARDPAGRCFGQLGEALGRRGLYAEAVAVCERGLQRHPDFVAARLVLGRALAGQGEVGRAEEEFRRVLAATPDSVPAHRALGDLLREQGRLAEALAAYEALLEFTPFALEVRGLAEGLRAATRAGVIQAAAQAPAATAPAAPVGALEAAPALFDLTAAAAEAPAPSLAPPVDAVPGAPPSVAPPLATETLADLYVRQGFLGEAQEIFQELLRADPSRDDVRAKLDALAGEIPAEPAPEPAGMAAPAPVPEDVVETLEAWLAAVQGLRAEGRRR